MFVNFIIWSIIMLLATTVYLYCEQKEQCLVLKLMLR